MSTTLIITIVVVVVAIFFLWNDCKVHCGSRDHFVANHDEDFSFSDIWDTGKSVYRRASPYVEKAVPYIKRAIPLAQEHLPAIVNTLRNDGVSQDKIECALRCLH
jgi:hypothetical protein